MEATPVTPVKGHHITAVLAVIRDDNRAGQIVVDECTVCFALVQQFRMNQHRAQAHGEE
jgi:hypothetical protein